MMLDIFSSFDLGTNFVYKIYPMRFLMGTSFIFCFMGGYWLTPSPFNILINWCLGYFDSSLRGGSAHLKGWNLMLSSLFFMILFVNFMGMVPYVYSYSSQAYFAFCLSLPVWVAIFLSSSSYSVSSYTIGLMPSGSPEVLSVVLIHLDFISIVCRALTLGLRLMISMTIGHIMLSFAGHLFIFLSSGWYFILALPVGLCIFFFEVGVSFLQAWIFWALIKLYSEEHTS